MHNRMHAGMHTLLHVQPYALPVGIDRIQTGWLPSQLTVAPFASIASPARSNRR
jgi:hypothetical protein